MPYLLIAVAVACFGSGFGLGYRLQSGKIATMEAGLVAQTKAAEAMLGAATSKVAKAEKAAQLANVDLEKTHASDIGTINAYHDRLAAVRLRDPGRVSCAGAVPKSASAPGVEGPTGDGAGLSEKFAGFLKSEAWRADQIAAYARACHKFVAADCGMNTD